MESVRLYAGTLRYLRPWQIAGRVIAAARRKGGFTRLPAVPSGLRNRLQPAVSFPSHDPWNERAGVQSGRFCFLNRTEDLGRPVDWVAARAPLLWQFNLHYFQYLSLLQPDEQERLCRDWIGANPVGRGVGWHPYPTSLRIVNWCRARVGGAIVLESLYQQAAYLYRNVETYVYGNHLLENARALILAGCFFKDQGEAPRWLERGLDLYRRETKEQILSDGGHFERSPMYHALMLEGYLDVLNVLPEDHPDRSWLEKSMRAMCDVLAALTHPDGQLALLNDATQEIALPVANLLDYAARLTGHEAVPADILPQMGYFVHRSDGIYLVIDGGVAGPDYLMAHAHADVFSYEMSLGGQQFIVDSGVYEYASGPMRDYVRATRAHNTVEIDGVSQIVCWGSFRVAERHAPEGVTFKKEVGRSRFEGSFAGYGKRIGNGICHRRTVTVDEDRRQLLVQDVIEGTGTHTVRSYIHLHPCVNVESTEAGAKLRRGVQVCEMRVTGAPLSWESGWYCPRFGCRERNTVAVIGGPMKLPARLSYAIDY